MRRKSGGVPPQRISTNFLDLDAKLADPKTASYAILPIPYDAATSFNPGTRRAPAAIIAASHHVELFDARVNGQEHERHHHVDHADDDGRLAEHDIERALAEAEGFKQVIDEPRGPQDQNPGV